MRNLIFAGSPNLVEQSFAAITAGGSTPASMPAENLKTSEPSQLAQILSLDPALTYWKVLFSFQQSGVSAFGIGNHNAGRNARVRIVTTTELTKASSPNAWLETAPNGVTAVSNWTAAAAAANVDDALSSLDGSTDGPTSTASVGVGRYDFATPSATPVTGTDGCFFGLRFSSSVSPAVAGRVAVKLYESGSFVRTLYDDVVTFPDDGSAPWLFAFFDASELATASLANVQAQVEITSQDGSVVRLAALRLYTREAPSAGIVDHGVFRMPEPPNLAMWGGNDNSYLSRALQQHFATALTSDLDDVGAVYFYVVDDQRDGLRTPDTCHEAGLLLVSPSHELELVNFAKGNFFRIADPSTKKRTHGGQDYGSRRRPRREFSIKLPSLSESEGWGLSDRLDALHGTMAPFWIIAYPDDPTASRHTSCPVTIKDMDWMENPKAFARKSKGYSLEECL